MGAQLRGVEVYCFDGRFHVHLPATLSPIIGKHGLLECRLDSVRRPGASAPTARCDAFDAQFGADRRLIIPSPLANHCGIASGSFLDITIRARLDEQAGWFRRRIVVSPIYPNDTVTFERGDIHCVPLSPWQLARLIERDMAEPIEAEAIEAEPAPSPLVSTVEPATAETAPVEDEAADRRRWLEILELYHAAKEGRIVVDNTRGIGIVPPEQPFRQAQSG
jgi:bifunctional DNA-binding transcriptional regulator/antitoxin component of YhaV-PrlF toxin-antitoxin module